MGELAALLAASAWAAGFVMLRAVPVRHRIFNLNALRMWGPACIYVVILVVLGWVPRFRELTWVNYAALSATVITGIGFSDLVMLRAMRVIGASRAYAIGGIAPLFTVLFAWLILSEEINRLLVLGAVLIVIGTALVTLRNIAEKTTAAIGSREYWLAITLTLSLAMVWGIDVVLMRIGVGETNPVVANSFRVPLAALFTSALAWRVTGHVIPPEMHIRNVWISILAGTIGVAAGSFLFLTSTQLIGAARAASISAISPVATLLLAVVFLNERPGLHVILGIMLAVVGVALVSLS